MAIETPDNTAQIENRVKTDVQRAAPDSDPYLKVSWLRSLIAGIARRQFDFYKDLDRTELRVMPDTADENTAPRWGQIYVGNQNPASQSTGNLIAQGTVGNSIPLGHAINAGAISFLTLASATIAANSLSVLSITRSGQTATATTSGDHNLSSFVPVTVAGANESEYNLTDAAITVISLDQFTYQVAGSPIDATGIITAAFDSASVSVQSVDAGVDQNLDLDTAAALQSPLTGIDTDLHVDFGAIGGGSDLETTDDYKARYLERIRKPVAHFNVADIIRKAKEITGVTRVFVDDSGTQIGTGAITTLTRSGNLAKAVTTAEHGYSDGQTVTVTGANEVDYNVTNTRILVEDDFIFYYLVLNTPTTPATGSPSAVVYVPLGRVVIYFMRDDDANVIPTASEVATVKAKIDTIRPANTSTNDVIVKAPTPVSIDFTFTAISPNTATMRDAIQANLVQFFEEENVVSEDIKEDAYRCAIQRTIVIDLNTALIDFTLSTPSGDIAIANGEIGVLGNVSFL